MFTFSTTFTQCHGCKSRGQGDESPEFGVGTLMQIVFPQILLYFKISNSRLLALQCSNAVKSLSTSLFQQSIHYFPKEHQCQRNHHFRRKIQHFSGKDTDKKYHSECTKTRHFKWKIHFLLGGGISLPQTSSPVGRGTPFHTRSSSPQHLLDPHCVPQYSRFSPLHNAQERCISHRYKHDQQVL